MYVTHPAGFVCRLHFWSLDRGREGEGGWSPARARRGVGSDGGGGGGSRSNLSANHRTPKIENGRRDIRPLLWPELGGEREEDDTEGRTDRQRDSTGGQKRENTRRKLGAVLIVHPLD